MKKKFNLIYSFIFFLILISCEQDPYPEDGQLDSKGKIEQKIVEPPLSLSVEDVMAFEENRPGIYLIRGAVKSPGKALITIDDLPQGAEFNSDNFELTWKPGFKAGNDPLDPSIKSRIYPITVWLRSSLDPVRALRKTVSLMVSDVAQEIKINTPAVVSVKEGQNLSQEITINDLDYPNGPFRVYATDYPANLKLVKLTNTNYRLEFSPDFQHVLINKQFSDVISYKGKISVSNPANHFKEISTELRVQDERIPSKIVLPPEIIGGLDINFQVVAYDLNKERAPIVHMMSGDPGYGKFQFSEVKNEENQSTVFNVEWRDIPPGFNGQEFNLSFRSCVLNSSGSNSLCTFANNKVRIQIKDRAPPKIDRLAWPAGEMIYLGYNELVNRKIVVRDGEGSLVIPKVEIFPESIRPNVIWANDQIRMKFDRPGVFQFNLVATTPYFTSASQSFLVEVFPQERNKTLLFADSTRDPEVLFYRSTFKNMDLMNPAIQEVDNRALAFRDMIVISSSILMDPQSEREVMTAIEKIKNVVVASPLINQLPKRFLDQLKNEYGLLPLGRYSELPNMPPIADMQMAKTSHFVNNQKPIYLKLNSSSESYDPMIFNGGLYEPTKICKGVLGLTPDGNNPFVIGAVCKRTGGGKISLLGTEWSDLKVEKIDELIPVSWFNTMINGNFRGEE